MDHISLRALTAHDIQILIKSCLIPLALKTQNDSLTFVYELKQEMHADLKYSESLEKEIDDLKSDKAEISNMYDTILQECVSNDVMCTDDQFAPVLGYEDLVQGNITINKVYYIEGLNHNLFSAGQFCDADLEHAVALASAQKNKGCVEAKSIVRAASIRVRFQLLTMPFCSGVRGVEV
nr:integrase, catalytic region, zinc finger, CCHC-type, peptidase aspartic, catalytic [Tanacetum cinerariifolium]